MKEYHSKCSMIEYHGLHYRVNGILQVEFNRRYKHWVDYESDYEQSSLCMVL